MSDTPPPATLRLTVDKDALEANWHALDTMSGDARAGAAVKADCYGLGVDICVPVLRAAGARNFFVAHWSEVEAVARHVPPHQISVLHGPLTAADCSYASETGAVPVINSLAQARIWLDGGGGPCDLMVDTGMNRLGIAPQEIGDDLIGRLEVRTLMSHLASADEDADLNAQQLARFQRVTAHKEAQRLSLANSAGIALGGAYHFDMTRPGLALYGGIPRPELEPVIKQVAFPQAAVLQVRDLQPGDHVGYNATYTASAPMRAATVSLGYADGYLRSWAGKGALEFQGHRLPILGKVSMDMVILDCTDCPVLREGDWLDVPYCLPDAAQHSGLSQYELLTVLGHRFTRI